jgi:hypothetical protein
MPDLFDEIKEDLSREKYIAIWQKYGNYFIAAAFAALILTGAGVAWQNHSAQNNSSYSDALYEASESPSEEAILKYDEIIANANSTYKAIAGIRKAALMLQNSNHEDALAVYKTVIETSGSPQELKDLAKLLYISISTNLAADSKEYDNITAKKYLQENIDGSGIFKYSALEIKGFQEINHHNYTKAKDIFNKIIESPESPEGIKTRARAMVETIANIDVSANDKGEN